MSNDLYANAAVKIVKDKLMTKSEEAIFASVGLIVVDEKENSTKSQRDVSEDIASAMDFYKNAKISEVELAKLEKLHFETVEDVLDNLKKEAQEFNLTPFQVIQGAAIFKKVLSTSMNSKIREALNQIELFTEE